MALIPEIIIVGVTRGGEYERPQPRLSAQMATDDKVRSRQVRRNTIIESKSKFVRILVIDTDSTEI